MKVIEGVNERGLLRKKVPDIPLGWIDKLESMTTVSGILAIVLLSRLHKYFTHHLSFVYLVLSAMRRTYRKRSVLVHH